MKEALDLVQSKVDAGFRKLNLISSRLQFLTSVHCTIHDSIDAKMVKLVFLAPKGIQESYFILCQLQ